MEMKIKICSIKVIVKIVSLQITLKTVLGGSRTDTFGAEVSDGRPATENVLSPNLVLVVGTVSMVSWYNWYG